MARNFPDVQQDAYDTDPVERDGKGLSGKPGVFARSDWRVIETWPNSIHYKVAHVPPSGTL